MVEAETFLADGERRAQQFLTEGIEAKIRSFAGLASRRGFAEKDPCGWAEFLAAVENGRWGAWKAEKPGRRRAPQTRA